MAFPVRIYKSSGGAAELAVAVSLATTDWLAPTSTVNDTVPQYPTALYVGGTGDLTVALAGDPATPVVLKSHPVGYAMISVSKIYKTGTTATNLVALF